MKLYPIIQQSNGCLSAPLQEQLVLKYTNMVAKFNEQRKELGFVDMGWLSIDRQHASVMLSFTAIVDTIKHNIPQQSITTASTRLSHCNQKFYNQEQRWFSSGLLSNGRIEYMDSRYITKMLSKSMAMTISKVKTVDINIKHTSNIDKFCVDKFVHIDNMVSEGVVSDYVAETVQEIFYTELIPYMFQKNSSIMISNFHEMLYVIFHAHQCVLNYNKNVAEPLLLVKEL